MTTDTTFRALLVEEGGDKTFTRRIVERSLDDLPAGEPTKISKLNTALELIFLTLVLSSTAYGWPDDIALLVLGASILVTVVISGTDYVVSWSKRAREGI